MRFPISLWFFLLSTGVSASFPSVSPTWEKMVPLEKNEGFIAIDHTTREIRFLKIGNYSFEPSKAVLEEMEDSNNWKTIEMPSLVLGKETEVLGHFQGMTAIRWNLKWALLSPGKKYRFHVWKNDHSEAFFNRIILVSNHLSFPQLGHFSLEESGRFGSALPAAVQGTGFSTDEIRALEQSLVDPVLDGVQEEVPWGELGTKVYPLDYQKILLSSPHDSHPGFTYQNGQWLITVPSIELGQGNEEDRWFIPTVRIGNRLKIPAPLSAETEWLRNAGGDFLPQIRFSWKTDGFIVNEWLSSQELGGTPHVVAKFQIHAEQAKQGQEPTLVLGFGRRPGVHFWSQQETGRSPLSFASLNPRLVAWDDRTFIDSRGDVILRSTSSLRILHQGEIEALVEVPLQFDSRGIATVLVSSPQRLVPAKGETNYYTAEEYDRSQGKFEKQWTTLLQDGATVSLPGEEWQKRVQNWLYQVLSITRIGDRLNYGAYYYKMFFGIEEGWPVMGLAQWGHAEEARTQAEILLSPENLDKKNYHHQYRNGLSSWYAMEVARMTGDLDWLRKISPVLLGNARWTVSARNKNSGDRTPVTLGLLPKHIYGGDISTPAYSLYSNATCWRGLAETADAFALLGETQLAAELESEADQYRDRLGEVISNVLDRSVSPAFLPMALEVETQSGQKANNERPYPRLTENFVGNYWSLFAPLFLHTGLLNFEDPLFSSRWLTDYLESHGGMWGGLPRFAKGLDAVYAIGYIHELLERSKARLSFRPKALAALESFLQHASSQNGFTIPEVSGFFPMRLSRNEYEKSVRAAPWMFGVYDAGQYLQGQISITEPLGAGAGEGLSLIRKALIDEIRDFKMRPNGGLFLFSSIPASWLEEGKVIQLNRMPTAYGNISVRVESFIRSSKQVLIHFKRETMSSVPLRSVRIRLVNPLNEEPNHRAVLDPMTIELAAADEHRIVIPFK